ncbi:L-2-amino-thiazoline-4-carboxylic acid hydrolase [Candidatus Bipolaricaulota bacterium]
MLEVRAYQAYDDAAELEIQVSAFGRRSLQTLDRFIGLVGERATEESETTLALLLDRVKLESTTLLQQASGLPDHVACECQSYERYSDLFLAHHNMTRGHLGVDESVWERDVQTYVLQTRLARAHYVPRYLMVKALVEVEGRERGVDLMKQFLDSEITRLPRPTSPPESIIELRRRDIPWNLDDKGQDAISALVSEHQCLKKVTACRTHKVLEPYGDPDLMEVVACYPDYASMRRTNEHFALTRTQTLINGGDYCDTCFHDTRFVLDFVHPTRDVFESLEACL